MDYLTATRKLWNHANLPEQYSEMPAQESLCFALWQAEKTKQEPNLDLFYTEIMECLEGINHGVNTERPSESIEGRADAIDRKVCYAVSQILSTCWMDHYRWTLQKTFSEAFLSKLARALIIIGIAWDLVLAGDIDEIRQDAEGEFEIWIQS